jgi:hypothetical protein
MRRRTQLAQGCYELSSRPARNRWGRPWEGRGRSPGSPLAGTRHFPAFDCGGHGVHRALLLRVGADLLGVFRGSAAGEDGEAAQQGDGRGCGKTVIYRPLSILRRMPAGLDPARPNHAGDHAVQIQREDRGPSGPGTTDDR